MRHAGVDLRVGGPPAPFFTEKSCDWHFSEDPAAEGSSTFSQATLGCVLVQDSWSKLRPKTSRTATRLGLANASAALVFHLEQPTCRTACNWRSKGFQSWACHMRGKTPDASRLVLSQSLMVLGQVPYGQYESDCRSRKVWDIKDSSSVSEHCDMAGVHTQLVVEEPAKVVGTFHSTHSMSLQRSAALPFTAWPPFHDYGWCGP